MEKSEMIEATFKDIELEMQKYNPNYEKWSLKKIATSLSEYQLFSTKLDDHFTILLRSADKNSVLEAKRYLNRCGFITLGCLDTFGYNEVRSDYLINKKLPLDIVNQTMDKVAQYLNLDMKKNKEIGKNKEGDYYFYFYPIKKDVSTWLQFKQGPYLDELNRFAKASKQSIDLIFAQLDNVVYGGLKLPGIASKEYEEAYFEAVNVQINKSNKRNLFIAIKNLFELVEHEEELSSLGQFQMFLVDKEIFIEENIEEIYLDFPNEVDDKVYASL